jgi:hypothetical protein
MSRSANYFCLKPFASRHKIQFVNPVFYENKKFRQNTMRTTSKQPFKSIRLSRLFFVAATAMGLMTGASSFGSVTISSPTNSTIDCSGSVSIQGALSCSKSCENGAPVVTITNSRCPGDMYQPSVSASCLSNVWTGTWGTAVDLAKGVNIITAVDDSGGSAQVSVNSNGGQGGNGCTYSWSGQPECTPYYKGFLATNTFCCLEYNLQNNGYYSFEETVSKSGCKYKGVTIEDILPDDFCVYPGESCASLQDVQMQISNSGEGFPTNCTQTVSQVMIIKNIAGIPIGTFHSQAIMVFGDGVNPPFSDTASTDGGSASMSCP